MTNFITDNTALPATKTDRTPPNDPTRQIAAADINTITQALYDARTTIQAAQTAITAAQTAITAAQTAITALQALRVTDAAATTAAQSAITALQGLQVAGLNSFTTKDLNLVINTLDTVGPELDWVGYSGNWFVGVDVANAPTSRDFVLTGVRNSYSFPDGVTTNASPTLTSASGGGFSSALIGAGISGPGIPAATTVTAVASSTSLTMSANATATASGLRVTITRGTVQDLGYWKHRGALSPTLGVGVVPPNGSARLQVSGQDDEPAMGALRLRRGPSMTGNIFTAHDSSPVDRLWIDKDFYLSGAHPLSAGAVCIAANSANQQALVLTGSNKTDFFSFDLPTGSGNVLRLKSINSGLICLDVGSDASLRHLSSKLGFFAATAIVKPAVTGSRGGNAALASLLTALSNLGLVTDSTTA